MMNKSLRFHTNEKEECAFAFLSVRSSLLFLGFFHCNFTVFINPFIKLSGFRILFDNAVNDFQYIITSLWQCNSRDFLSSLELYIRQSKVIIEYKVLLGNDASTTIPSSLPFFSCRIASGTLESPMTFAPLIELSRRFLCRATIVQ